MCIIFRLLQLNLAYITMKYLYLSVISLFLLSSCKTSQVATVVDAPKPMTLNHADIIHQEVSQRGIKSHIQFLASDALRGRDTGSEGLEAAAAYIAANFAAAGIGEVNNTHFQTIPFVTFTPPKEASLSIGDIGLSFPNDFIAINGKAADFSAATVDIGYGNQDDINGKDLNKKIAVSIAGDGVSQDPRDWIAASNDKRKRAKAAGALALVEIYQSTAIPWRFLRRIGTQAQTTFDEGTEQSDMVNIWVGTTDSLTIATLRAGDQPLTIKMDAVSREQITSDNVMGLIEGTDPTLKNEYIVYTAHYDHVGVGAPDDLGDEIYNGARDNAVGVTAVLSLANYFAAHPPKRSAMFVLFTAEEKGLLGSKYFTEHLPVAANQIKYNFNIDNGGYNDTSIISVIGLTRTEAEMDIQKACNEIGLQAIEDPAKEQGLFDRSDNVNFAVLGIPAPTFSLGFRAFDEEIFKYYHRPGDQVETLDMDYIEKYVKAYILSAIHIDGRKEAPFWLEGDKYYDAGVQLYGKN